MDIIENYNKLESTNIGKNVLYASTNVDGGGIYLWESNPMLINSILWNNSPESIYLELYGENQEPIITYSDIEGGWEGEGNIDIDPFFTDPENGDYTLQEGSPCIDTGIEIEDMEYFGSAPDMGAFEYVGDDSNTLIGDLNGDSYVNIVDIVTLVNFIFGGSPYSSEADINDDGFINIVDVVQLVNIILDI